MDFNNTEPANLTQPAMLSAEPVDNRASMLFKLVTFVAFLLVFSVIVLH
jgi:hypothetical protein